MVDVLLLWQVGFLEVIIRISYGTLHQWDCSILDVVGRIGLPLSLIRLSFGRLWDCVWGGCRRRGGCIELIGLRGILILIGIIVGVLLD